MHTSKISLLSSLSLSRARAPSLSPFLVLSLSRARSLSIPLSLSRARALFCSPPLSRDLDDQEEDPHEHALHQNRQPQEPASVHGVILKPSSGVYNPHVKNNYVTKMCSGSEAGSC